MANLLIPATNWATATTIDAEDFNTIQNEVSAAFAKLGVAHPDHITGVGNTFSTATSSDPLDMRGLAEYNTDVDFDLSDELAEPTTAEGIAVQGLDTRIRKIEMGFVFSQQIAIDNYPQLAGRNIVIDADGATTMFISMGGHIKLWDDITGGWPDPETLECYQKNSSNVWVRNAALDIPEGSTQFDITWGGYPNKDFPTMVGEYLACGGHRSVAYPPGPQHTTTLGFHCWRNVGLGTPVQQTGGYGIAMSVDNTWVLTGRQETRGVSFNTHRYNTGTPTYASIGYYNYGSPYSLEVDIFKLSGGVWTFVDNVRDVTTPLATDNNANAMVLCANDDFVIIGAYEANAYAGYCKVIKRDTGADTWTLLETLTDSSGGADGLFGCSAAFKLDGTLAIATQRGDMVIFEWSGTSWVQIDKTSHSPQLPIPDLAGVCISDGTVAAISQPVDSTSGGDGTMTLTKGLIPYTATRLTPITSTGTQFSQPFRSQAARYVDIGSSMCRPAAIGGDTLAVTWAQYDETVTGSEYLPVANSLVYVNIYDKD